MPTPRVRQCCRAVHWHGAGSAPSRLAPGRCRLSRGQGHSLSPVPSFSFRPLPNPPTQLETLLTLKCNWTKAPRMYVAGPGPQPLCPLLGLCHPRARLAPVPSSSRPPGEWARRQVAPFLGQPASLGRQLPSPCDVVIESGSLFQDSQKQCSLSVPSTAVLLRPRVGFWLCSPPRAETPSGSARRLPSPRCPVHASSGC